MSCWDLVLQTLAEATELLLHAGLLEPLGLFTLKQFSEKHDEHKIHLKPVIQHGKLVYTLKKNYLFSLCMIKKSPSLHDITTAWREFCTFVSSRMWGIYSSPAPFPLSGSDLRFKLGYCASVAQPTEQTTEVEVEESEFHVHVFVSICSKVVFEQNWDFR